MIIFFKLYPITSGDLLSSNSGNVIPMMALVFALVSSFNSVGVSVYQEQLFKVQKLAFRPWKQLISKFNLFQSWNRKFYSKSDQSR